jgi:hypothetical protein
MNYPPFAMIFKDQFWRGLVIHQANRVISRYAELVEERRDSGDFEESAGRYPPPECCGRREILFPQPVACRVQHLVVA